MRLDLFRSILKSVLVPLILGVARTSSAAPVDDPATMLRSSIDEMLSVAYAGHGNENLPARVRPLVEKSFALRPRDPPGHGSRMAAIFRSRAKTHY